MHIQRGEKAGAGTGSHMATLTAARYKLVQPELKEAKGNAARSPSPGGRKKQ